MRKFTAQEIQGKFDKLPEEVREAITSAEVNEKIEAIGKKNGLLIDQMGELADEVGLVMLGLSRSNDFVNNIISRCSVSRKVAGETAKDINDEVFGSIREHMRKLEMGTETENGTRGGNPEIMAVEQAGDFEILENDEEAGVGAMVSTLQGPAGVKMTVDGAHTDIIADHLLNNPVAVKREKIVVKAPEKEYGSDPYREPIK